MSETQGEPIAVQLQVRGDHWCFGCGQMNPHGLKLCFYEDSRSGGVFTWWTPTRTSEGFSGLAHGGMISTVLDEVMGWAISHRDIFAVTGTLEVKFRRPVEIGAETIARAWIAAERGRKLDLRAELSRRNDGTLLAEATAIFVKVSDEIAEDFRERYLDRFSTDRDST